MLCLYPQVFKGSVITTLLGKCQHQQIPTGKEEIKNKSLFPVWNRTVATCSTLPAKMFNSWLCVQYTQI